MKVLAFSVYDKAVEAYMQPFFMRSKGEAIRSWTQAVGDPKSNFCAHPEDYILFCVGAFEDGSGIFTVHEPEKIITALELVKKPE